ncbi:UNVERIFIED_CONTAM: hypothetical protein Sangu_1559700 [Sesamum angustifolium]|uniref:DDE Tnp4 domain-containing protein n=1 Tax=Sesamum angustifolium TaxID=2727405 RepID=A0AAW2MQV5_9LAMI
MDNVQRKRSREKLESDEEDIEIVIYLLSFLIGTVGAWYHENYLLKDLSMSDNDERAYRRALWMRQFHTVLRAVLKVGKLYVKQQSDGIFHERDAERWKWFPNAMGALDGTFVELTVPAEERSRYRNRKGAISTNVLGVCDANLKFLYVLPGWEGSASDARVLRDALQRPNGLKVYSDKYYLVDAGYTNGPGFLAPYRATRYHLNEWKGNTPTNFKELFNLRHSSARNAIERTFGLLKKRWAILRTASFYNVKTQIRIINACCILHNFIRGEMPIDPLLDEVDRELESNLRIEDDDSYNEEQITIVRNTNEDNISR